MAPILFTVERHAVYSYQAVFLLCLTGAFGWLAWTDHRRGDGRLDAALWALLAGLAGGRLVHVLANAEYFAELPAKAISPAGGFSFHGGLLAGLAGLFAYSWWTRRRSTGATARFQGLLAALLPALALGLIGGWLGCLLGGCAYGRALPPPQRFYTPDWPDLYGVRAFRLPSQPLGLALAVALLVIAGRAGRYPGLFLVLLGIGDLLIAFTRGDLELAWGPLLAVQWADLALIALGLALMWAARRPRSPTISPSGESVA